MSSFTSTAALFHHVVCGLQDTICSALEKEDSARFREDEWVRAGGGGGKTRVIENGETFEKGGVNTSEVFGELKGQEIEMFSKMIQAQGIPVPDLTRASFFATGISLVIHPKNPFVPTTHANYRYFELQYPGGELWWFGGGADLTPYYHFEKDESHFHTVHKRACDTIDPSYYPLFKEECDRYFYLAHRQETRGVGGIFYDHLRSQDKAHYIELATVCGQAFIDAYIPIVQKQKNHTYENRHREWQEIRRGRYVEFNLIYDKGTLFGLKTGGRIESILMSLPQHVQWRYDYHPEIGSDEENLVRRLKK